MKSTYGENKFKGRRKGPQYYCIISFYSKDIHTINEVFSKTIKQGRGLIKGRVGNSNKL